MENSETIYIKENGCLQLVTGKQSTWRREYQTSTVKRPRLNLNSDEGCKNQHTYYIKEFNECVVFSPMKLTDMCINFVGCNIIAVSSLCGFPDIIGQKIFDVALKYGIFNAADQKSVEALKLFTDAYDEYVMEKLNLNSCHHVINFYEDHLTLFRHLTELDFSHCKLGDNHDLVAHIMLVKSLSHLCLKDNALTDYGLQKYTTPLRMFKNGCLGLKYLDLSCNPGLTEMKIKYLFIWKDLEALDLSGTSVKFTDPSLSRLKEKMNMTVVKESTTIFHRNIENTGWAAGILSAWQYNAQPHSTVQSQSKQSNEAQKFYGCKTGKLRYIKSIPASAEPPATPCIQLVRDKSMKPKKFDESITQALPFNNKNNNCRADTSCSAVTETSEFPAEILAMYTGSPAKKPVS